MNQRKKGHKRIRYKLAKKLQFIQLSDIVSEETPQRIDSSSSNECSGLGSAVNAKAIEDMLCSAKGTIRQCEEKPDLFDISVPICDAIVRSTRLSHNDEAVP
jgi:hypothetical protein